MSISLRGRRVLAALAVAVAALGAVVATQRGETHPAATENETEDPAHPSRDTVLHPIATTNDLPPAPRDPVATAATTSGANPPSRDLEPPAPPRSMPVPTPEQQRATAVRQNAFSACIAGEWNTCESLLDQAAQLDPSGDKTAYVQSWRQSIAAAGAKGLNSPPPK